MMTIKYNYKRIFRQYTKKLGVYVRVGIIGICMGLCVSITHAQEGLLIVSFEANPPSVSLGDGTTLTWVTTAYAQNCALFIFEDMEALLEEFEVLNYEQLLDELQDFGTDDGEELQDFLLELGQQASLAPAGYPEPYSMEIESITTDTLYLLYCAYNEYYAEHAEVIVTVTSGPPTLDHFIASPDEVGGGGMTTLEWEVMNADTCTAASIPSDYWSGDKSASDGIHTENVENIVEDVDFGISCVNGEGSATLYASVTVTTPPPPATISLFEANPTTIPSGEETILYWDSENANSCDITSTLGDSWIGEGVSGSKDVSPSDDVTYTLVCSGAGGDSDPAYEDVTVHMQCEDGEDNEPDGHTDYPDDPGCSSSEDNDESDDPVIPACSDGIDNDGDGWIDYPVDPGCGDENGTDENNLGMSSGRKQVHAQVSSSFLGFYADPQVVPYDGTTTLYWQPHESIPWARCFARTDVGGEWVDWEISGAWTEKSMTGGADVVTNIQSDATYMLNCYGGGYDVEEYTTVIVSQCSDGIDNDGDELIDLGDPDCDDLLDTDESGGGDGGDSRDDLRPDSIDIDER